MVERSARTTRHKVVRVRTLHAVPNPSTVELSDETTTAAEVTPTTAATKTAATKTAATKTAATKTATTKTTGSSRPRWRSATSILLVLLVLALAGAVVTGRQWYQHRQLDAAHQAALTAAKQTTVDFVTISAASIDRDLQRVVAGATGDFKDEFTRGMPQVRSAVIENEVESTGNVLRAGLVSGDLDSAVVLVAVDASVKNTGAPDGRLSHYRIQVDVAKDADAGRWLISRLQFIG